jgi:hypothetical protein
VLAILSLVPVFASQISSLRYLGITGMLFAAWKGYRVSDLQNRSDRLKKSPFSLVKVGRRKNQIINHLLIAGPFLFFQLPAVCK